MTGMFFNNSDGNPSLPLAAMVNYYKKLDPFHVQHSFDFSTVSCTE